MLPMDYPQASSAAALFPAMRPKDRHSPGLRPLR
jgi:hypothetical protein